MLAEYLSKHLLAAKLLCFGLIEGQCLGVSSVSFLISDLVTHFVARSKSDQL